MGRGFALFLLAVGVVLGAVGTIGVVALAFGPGKLPAEALVAFLVVDLIGVLLLVWAVRILRRTKPIGETALPVDADGRGYVPNVPQLNELDGSPYTVLYTPPVPGKNPVPSSLRVSTPVPAAGEFQVVRETGYDRACKRWGLAVEIETGDEAFDEACYVRSDTPAFAAAYLADPVKRVAILDMRRLGFPDVTMKDGTVSVAWVGFDPGRHDQPDLAADAAARLVLLARNLPPHQPEFDERTGDGRKRSLWVLWLFLVGFALTVISLAVYRPMSGWDVFRRAGLVLVVGWPVFALASAVLLRGTSTSHIAWGQLLIGSAFLFPLGSVGAVGLVNGAGDTSPDVVRDMVIVEKYTTRSKNSTNYHVRCASWREPGGTESFGVSWSEYDKVAPNQSRLVVTTRAGALGVEWVVGKHVAPPGGKR